MVEVDKADNRRAEDEDEVADVDADEAKDVDEEKENSKAAVEEERFLLREFVGDVRRRCRRALNPPRPRRDPGPWGSSSTGDPWASTLQ